MAIKAEWVRYGDEVGYLALPAQAETPLPGGRGHPGDHGSQRAHRGRDAPGRGGGYVALAPDLFSVKGQRPPALTRERVAAAMAFMRRLPPTAMGDAAARDAELARLPEPERGQIGESFGQIWGSTAPARMEAMTGQLRKAVRYLRSERPETKGSGWVASAFAWVAGFPRSWRARSRRFPPARSTMATRRLRRKLQSLVPGHRVLRREGPAGQRGNTRLRGGHAEGREVFRASHLPGGRPRLLQR